MARFLQKRKTSKELVAHGKGGYRQPGVFDEPGKLPWRNRAIAKIRETRKKAASWAARNIGVPIALAAVSFRTSIAPMEETSSIMDERTVVSVHNSNPGRKIRKEK